jgi:hypothetical protein
MPMLYGVRLGGYFSLETNQNSLPKNPPEGVCGQPLFSEPPTSLAKSSWTFFIMFRERVNQNILKL